MAGAPSAEPTAKTGPAAGHEAAPRNKLGQERRRIAAKLPLAFRMCEFMGCPITFFLRGKTLEGRQLLTGGDAVTYAYWSESTVRTHLQMR